jgi:hypothetical protein
MFNPLLGLLAILALMVAYIAANWGLVLAVFNHVYESMVDGLSDLMLWVYDGLTGVATAIKDFFVGVFDSVRKMIGGIVDDLAALPDRARSMLSRLPGIDLFGDGVDVAGSFAPGALNPAVDATGAAARAAASRSVTVAPTITLQVDARDRTTEDATGVVRGAIEGELWRELTRAYDGDED